MRTGPLVDALIEYLVGELDSYTGRPAGPAWHTARGMMGRE
ncbi:hypothetical protein ACFVYR_36630 [Streptomyces sp. NPDC058284]